MMNYGIGVGLRLTNALSKLFNAVADGQATFAQIAICIENSLNGQMTDLSPECLAVLRASIETLPISPRAISVLQEGFKVETIDDLMGVSSSQILNYRIGGERVLQEIQKALEPLRLRLPDSEP